ncbi:MAG: hypothetical protein WDN45_05635 [Caulobacteraceae bacterium]
MHKLAASWPLGLRMSLAAVHWIAKKETAVRVAISSAIFRTLDPIRCSSGAKNSL